jgi:hypothetical protein
LVQLIHDAADFAKHQSEFYNYNSKLPLVLEKLDLLVRRVMSSSSSGPPLNMGMQNSGIAKPQPATLVQQQVVAGNSEMQDRTDQNHMEPSVHRTYEPQAYDDVGTANVDSNAVFGESPALSLDAALSPDVTHGIGWDWIDFSQLFPETMEGG